MVFFNFSFPPWRWAWEPGPWGHAKSVIRPRAPPPASLYFFIEEMWAKLNGWTLCLLLFTKRAKSTGLLKTRLSEGKGDSACPSRLPRRVGPRDLRWDSATSGKTSLEGHFPLPNHSCAQKNAAPWSSLLERCSGANPRGYREAQGRRGASAPAYRSRASAAK